MKNKIARRDFLKWSSVTFGSFGITSASSNASDLLKLLNLANWPMQEDEPEEIGHNDDAIKDYLYKIQNFENDFVQDVKVNENDYKILLSSLARLERLQRVIGHGNFNLISFDDYRYYAKNISKVGEIPQEEVDFFEEIFYSPASKYGFLGKKVNKNLTTTIAKKAVIKVSGSGNFLYTGRALKLYDTLKKEVGPDLILTSGIRSIVKQAYLFFKKVKATNGNLSRASRSLAPPGHSYHAVGDFDVGKRGLGLKNFTADFANTEIYKKLMDLGHVSIRYTQKNPFGVRYEPWHIKVTPS